MKKNYDRFIDTISSLDVKILEKEPMGKHTTFKIGGPADLFIVVNTKNSLIKILKAIKKFQIPFKILGNGSNLLVSDEGVKGAVIKLGENFKKIKILSKDSDKAKIYCGAGVQNSKFCIFAKENGFSGTEFLYGIPGTIGGAIYMNAGAYSSEIKDIVVSSESIAQNGETISLNKEQMKFSYRRSIFSENKNILISAIFELVKGDPEKIALKMEQDTKKRKGSQPLNFPNAGSIFKRPANNFASKLIDECNLKGLQVGGAMVSQKHAGFIVNTGNAKCKEVLEIIKTIKDTVAKKTSLSLDLEIDCWL